MNVSKFSFEIHPSSGVPIYRQIMDQVTSMIVSGKLAANDELPSTRQMAAELEINMMTVSKAYTRLEAEGWIERVRGIGMRVCEVSVETSVKERQKLLTEQAQQLVNRGQQLLLTEEQMIQVVRKVLQEREK